MVFLVQHASYVVCQPQELGKAYNWRFAEPAFYLQRLTYRIMIMSGDNDFSFFEILQNLLEIFQIISSRLLEVLDNRVLVALLFW